MLGLTFHPTPPPRLPPAPPPAPSTPPRVVQDAGAVQGPGGGGGAAGAGGRADRAGAGPAGHLRAAQREAGAPERPGGRGGRGGRRGGRRRAGRADAGAPGAVAAGGGEGRREEFGGAEGVIEGRAEAGVQPSVVWPVLRPDPKTRCCRRARRTAGRRTSSQTPCTQPQHRSSSSRDLVGRARGHQAGDAMSRPPVTTHQFDYAFPKVGAVAEPGEWWRGF